VSSDLQALVALDGEVDRGLIEELVARDPRVSVLDYLELGGPSASGLGAGDALIVAVADYTSEVRDFIASSNRQHPSRPIVLLCPAGVHGDGYLSEAFDNGVDDIVALPQHSDAPVDPHVTRQLVFALEKAVIRRRGVGETKASSNRRVICVLGLKGGSGKTLTSTNLAVSLADEGHSVALLDLDLQFGDAALAMGLSPERTIYDLVRSGGSLDQEKLDDFLMEHTSGARALLAPVRPDQAAMITVPFLSEVERMLADMHDFLVIDTPPSFNPEVISAIDSSTDVLVVAMRDTLSLKNTRLGLETLERMDYDRRRVKILLNRADTNVGIEREDVLAILGRDVDVLVPSGREITRSVNQGTPIAMQRATEAARSFRQLAQLYIDDAQLAAPAEPQVVRSVVITPRPKRQALFLGRNKARARA
jgi:pilus assembly protein CpaE